MTKNEDLKACPQPSDADMAMKLVDALLEGFKNDYPIKATRDEMLSIKAALQSTRKPPDGMVWHEGEPPKPYRDEWFIAILKNGTKSVLRSLPEEYSHDYKTADETYYTKGWVKKWMQFPNSNFIPYEAAPPILVDAISIKREALQGVREALDAQRQADREHEVEGASAYWCILADKAYQLRKEALASLDAVLEGE